ncbi:MAG: HAD-IB family hydrolase [Acidobacteria bacterium]|nr:HAD-IB family hydrolase [Acidobacteriota bacterium]
MISSNRAAVFDVDGTLIQANSFREFTRWAILSANIMPWKLLYLWIGSRLGRYSRDYARFRIVSELKGKTSDELIRIGRLIFETRLRKRLRPEAVKLLEEQRLMGRVVIIASAGYDFLIQPIGAAIDVSHIICTELAFSNGVFNGQRVGPEVAGVEKLRRVASLIGTLNISLADTAFFTDCLSDLPLLRAVGHPFLVCKRGSFEPRMPEKSILRR